MKKVVWGLVLLLVVLHQDIWMWDNDGLAFGFLPVTLLYHAGISVAASAVWLLAVRFAWPVEEDESPAVPASERPVPKTKVNPRFAGGDDVQGAPA